MIMGIFFFYFNSNQKELTSKIMDTLDVLTDPDNEIEQTEREEEAYVLKITDCSFQKWTIQLDSTEFATAILYLITTITKPVPQVSLKTICCD